MSEKSFYDFVQSRYAGEDSPEGDFAEDMRDDFPKKLMSHQSILMFLHRRHACWEAIEVFEKLWGEYERKID